MRKLIQKLLKKPVSKLAARFESRPDKDLVHSALTNLFHNLNAKPGKYGPVLSVSPADKFIVFSDQHKGGKDGSDDFSYAERNYLRALEYYNEERFTFISLGDAEELWENNILTVTKYNKSSFELEKLFLRRKAFIKVFGNHDLYWDNDPLAPVTLRSIYGEDLKVFEGVILKIQVSSQPLSIFLTHGHQGDKQSDGNWFSKWFVSTIWAPLQLYLELNLNTPAYNTVLKSKHNQFMYEWVAPLKNVLLITGHTHQPVFLSLTYLERLFGRLFRARQANDREQVESLQAEIKIRGVKENTKTDFLSYQPTYFNTGCCCFSDGDITGIEIEGGYMRLIKWEYDEQNISGRIVLEEVLLEKLVQSFATPAKEIPS
ncbi:metallophosphoesterase [Desertivirga arenae]|uniref:metallophosphoesterase n=1 Tax=Desertivirga arenae TaxID=2810309 RepID=UPI001A970B03|nr:metallophosphoesterase [Pedobacter sp. SYSU D00823]